MQEKIKRQRKSFSDAHLTLSNLPLPLGAEEPPVFPPFFPWGAEHASTVSAVGGRPAWRDDLRRLGGVRSGDLAAALRVEGEVSALRDEKRVLRPEGGGVFGWVVRLLRMFEDRRVEKEERERSRIGRRRTTIGTVETRAGGVVERCVVVDNGE